MDWLEGITDSIAKSPYCSKNRFTSFSPIRQRNWAKWYINGHEYYKDMAQDLENAKSEIYITDWWFSPEIYLIRPIKKIIKINEKGEPYEEYDTYWRLDEILKRKALEGVKIHILVYREFEQALANNSTYVQNKMMNLCDNDNIEVIRHPSKLIFLWSHHEKSVTIDQKISYMGGLDLCFGRWDLADNPITDPGNEKDGIYFPGQDYSNVRIKDFENVDQYETPLIDKNSQPRMPWRDIAIKMKGLITKDLTRHFIQYWNFAKNDLEGKKRKNIIQKKFYKKTKKRKKKKKRNKKVKELKREDTMHIEQSIFIALNSSTTNGPPPNSRRHTDGTLVEAITSNQFQREQEKEHQKEMEKSSANLDRFEKLGHLAKNNKKGVNYQKRMNPAPEKADKDINRWLTTVVRRPNQGGVADSVIAEEESEEVVSDSEDDEEKIIESQIRAAAKKEKRKESLGFGGDSAEDVNSDSDEAWGRLDAPIKSKKMEKNSKKRKSSKNAFLIPKLNLTASIKPQGFSKGTQKLFKLGKLNKMKLKKSRLPKARLRVDKPHDLTQSIMVDPKAKEDDLLPLIQARDDEESIQAEVKLKLGEKWEVGDEDILESVDLGGGDSRRSFDSKNKRSVGDLSSSEDTEDDYDDEMEPLSLAPNSARQRMTMQTTHSRKRRMPIQNLTHMRRQDFNFPRLDELKKSDLGNSMTQNQLANTSGSPSKKKPTALFANLFGSTDNFLTEFNPKILMKRSNTHKHSKRMSLFNDFTCNCQMLRSASHWSIGLRENQTENSIQMAYLELISNAEKFIYIENQFFVSSTSGDPVKNRIAETIIARVERAIEKKEDFKVAVFIPLLPGFEGGIDEKTGNVMRIQLGWAIRTIKKGKNSIYQR